MQCPKCNILIPEDSVFCQNCGINVAEEIAKLQKFVKCDNCGKEVDKNTKFCKFCGNKIDIDKITKVNTKSKVSDKVRSLSGDKITLFIIIIIALVLLCLAIGRLMNYSESAQTTTPEPSVETTSSPTIDVQNVRVINKGYGLQKIQGIIKNTSSYTCAEPQVIIYTYNSSGNRIGEEYVPIFGALSPNETFEFSIPVTNVSSFKVMSSSCY